MGPTERPTASQRDVDTKAEPPRLLLGKAQRIHVLVRQVSEVMESSCGIIEGQRIEGGNLNAANPCGLHLFEFTLKLRLGYGGTKPPPTHHDPAVVRWVYKCFAKSGSSS